TVTCMTTVPDLRGEPPSKAVSNSTISFLSSLSSSLSKTSSPYFLPPPLDLTFSLK
uniref:Uncharacterized protein n=1 Tax=Amphilophus citrinellus TaxID=61819 RepID=A0A3Q0T6H8_AMPCI